MRAAVSRHIRGQAQSCRSYFCQETARFLGVPLPGKQSPEIESAQAGLDFAFAYASSLSDSSSSSFAGSSTSKVYSRKQNIPSSISKFRISRLFGTDARMKCKADESDGVQSGNDKASNSSQPSGSSKVGNGTRTHYDWESQGSASELSSDERSQFKTEDQKQSEKENEIKIRMGRAVDVLKKDYPDLFSRDPDFSIYADDNFTFEIRSSGPLGYVSRGKKNYQKYFPRIRKVDENVFYLKLNH